MPLDSAPTARFDPLGIVTPRQVAEVTPAGTVREPVLAAVICAIRDLTAAPTLPS